MTKGLTEFSALSFDCYGTLIDWETGIAAVLGPWANERGLEMTDEALLTAYSGHEARAEAEHPGELYPAILARALRDLGRDLGTEVSGEDAERLARSVPDWPAFADSHDALAALATRYQLIILSNVDRDSFAVSNRRLGVSFTSVLTAEDIGSYKPSMRNFDALLAEVGRLGIEKDRLLHVAQSLSHDHVPAKQAGLPTVWINRRHDQPGWGATPAPAADVTPDWEFPSMAAFAAAVAAETGGAPAAEGR
jgi:2-haloalkanoic acid dehalogenase type II